MTDRDLFLAALDVPPGDRTKFLAEQCAGDPTRLQRVERLLTAHAAAGSFLDQPADPGPTRTFDPAVPLSTHAVGPAEEAGIVIGGRYKLIEPIGVGGMGSVWMAQQTDPVKRVVAVKLIKAGMDSKAVLARFEAERQALALMDHPNIARVLDAGATAAGRPYFVMELVKGVPITKYCDDHKLTPRQRLELFVPVCQAIQHAHQKGVIHRDVKPSNVLVAMYDDRPEPKVIDFGVAKATGSQLTDHTLVTGFGAVVGTPEYMSPEQASFNQLDVDTRSDVYALGVLLYELLTGTTPIDRKSLGKAAILEVLRLVREEESPRPSTRLSTDAALPSIAANRGTEPSKLSGLLRGELDWVVMKAIEKDRSRRYETANGLARDVQRYLADEVVEARPPTVGYRVRKFARRNKGRVAAAGLVLLALVGGIVGTTGGLLRAEWARQAEADQRAIAEASEREAQGEKAKAVTAAAAERLAKEAEAEQRKEAEDANQRAVQALQSFTDDLMANQLAARAVLSEDEKAILGNAVKQWEVFARSKGESAAARGIRANGAYSVARAQSKLGLKTEAAANNRASVELYERLAAEFPAEPKYRSYLADSHTNLGLVLEDLEKPVEAEEQFRKALPLRGKMAADFPTEPKYHFLMAQTHSSLGVLLARLNRRKEAEEQYRTALAIRRELASQYPNEPRYLAHLAVSHNNLGLLLSEIRRRAEAEEQYRKALAIQEKLAGEFPLDPEHRAALAKSHLNLGVLLAGLKKRAEAEAEYKTALAILEKLAPKYPSMPQYRDTLAGSHHNLGGLLREDPGKRAEAEEHFRKALAVRETLAEEYRDVPQYRLDLAGSHNNLGNVLADFGKRAEAEEHYRKALPILAKLVDEFPKKPHYRILLGGGCCNFGLLLRDSGKPADSLVWFDKAILTLTPVANQDQRSLPARQFLINSYSARAATYDRLDKSAEALKDRDKAVELSPSDKQPIYRSQRATSRLRAGQVAEAAAEMAELTESDTNDAGHWYNFACFYAVASGKVAAKKQEYGDRAMELLKKAVAAGFRDAAHMAKDTDLDPLRDRADFKQLVASLQQ